MAEITISGFFPPAYYEKLKDNQFNTSYVDHWSRTFNTDKLRDMIYKIGEYTYEISPYDKQEFVPFCGIQIKFDEVMRLIDEAESMV